MSTSGKDVKLPKPLPPPNSDFYQLAETLPPEELATLKQVRSFMESKVAPIINKYWVEDSFPFELLPAFKELNLGGLGIQTVAEEEAHCSPVLLQWRWHALTLRSLLFLESTVASPCYPSMSPDQKNRNRSGCHLWLASKKSGVLA